MSDINAVEVDSQSERRCLTPNGRLEKRTGCTVVDGYFAREGLKLRSVNARRSTFNRLVLPVLGERR